MRVVSWNVNGIRAGVRHGFVGFVDRSAADIVGVQEVRARPEDIPPAARRPPGWHTAFTVAERRGYSGVGLYSKLQPVRVDTSLGVPRFDREGRFMAGHFQTARGQFVVVNSYFPKGSGPARDNSRVGYKLDFSRTVFARAQELLRRDPVLVIGDYNTAHRAIDLARPQANVTHSGFLPEERAELDRWIDAGWVDAFRALHPEVPDQYMRILSGSVVPDGLRGRTGTRGRGGLEEPAIRPGAAVRVKASGTPSQKHSISDHRAADKSRPRNESISRRKSVLST